MAITILSQPDFIQPIYSLDGHNTAFVLESTDSSLCSMKYVSEISINGSYVTTIKNSPNLADGKCVSIPYKVLGDFLSYDLWRGPNFQLCPNSIIDYTVRFGEESDGTFDCSSGDYEITWGPSFSGKAFNGTIQYLEESFSENNWLIASGNNGRFLTNSPDTQSISEFEHSTLYYIQQTQNLTGSTSSGPSASTALQIIITNEDNTTETWYALNLLPGASYSMWAIGVGPSDINGYVEQGIVYSSFGSQATEPLIECGVKSYSVRITDYEIVG